MAEGISCVCKWKNCSSLRKQLLDKCPEHVWSGKARRYQFRKGKEKVNVSAVKKFVTESSIRHHLKPDRLPQNSHIFPHHFPVPLLEHIEEQRKQGKNIKVFDFIDDSDMKRIADMDGGSNRLLDRSNKAIRCFECYPKKDKLSKHQTKQIQGYIVSPMSTEAEVMAHLKAVATPGRSPPTKQPTILSPPLIKKSLTVDEILNIVPSVDKCQRTIRLAFKQMVNMEKSTINAKLLPIAKVMSLVHECKTAFPLDDKCFYHPCSSMRCKQQCNYFSILDRPSTKEGRECDFCKIISRKRDKLQSYHNNKPPKKKRRFETKLMTKQKLVSMLQKQTKTARDWKNKCVTLKKALKEKEHDFSVTSDHPFHKILKKSLVGCLSSEDTRCQLQEIAASALIEKENPSEEEKAEITSCVETMLENMRNLKMKFEKNESRIRFSAHTVNVAMSIWLRNKSAYEELRNSGLLCLPSSMTLKNINRSSQVSEGGDPRLYSQLIEEVEKSEEQVIGHLMLDEIKLKNGIAHNASNKEILGFIVDEIDPKKCIKEMISDKTK